MDANRTGYVILGMLSLCPSASGYEIRKAIESSVGHFWGESYGQIYPSLRRLESEKLIRKVRSSAAKSKLRRQQYSITDSGRTCLRQWLRLPFQNERPRNEFLLKLFFGGEVGPLTSIAQVRELQEKNQHALDMLLGIEAEANKNAWPQPHRPYWMLTLSLGIALARAALQWGESALAELSSIDPSARSQPVDPAIETINPPSTVPQVTL